MTIVIQPTKIKQSFYLLIPKNIVDLIDIKDNTKLSLKVKKIGKNQALEYEINEKTKTV